ncbi:hypothetical protein PIB30_044958 [Stylosanthes scabra]|uniref:Uncharacterized protein n=1 Tax=Stylosanthes scabra TaxID=79078 RepID=A0ABU6TH00_9FABA|nr:hypothetical protein [Stylosanthes scabra]
MDPEDKELADIEPHEREVALLPKGTHLARRTLGLLKNRRELLPSFSHIDDRLTRIEEGVAMANYTTARNELLIAHVATLLPEKSKAAAFHFEPDVPWFNAFGNQPGSRQPECGQGSAENPLWKLAPVSAMELPVAKGFESGETKDPRMKFLLPPRGSPQLCITNNVITAKSFADAKVKEEPPDALPENVEPFPPRSTDANPSKLHRVSFQDAAGQRRADLPPQPPTEPLVFQVGNPSVRGGRGRGEGWANHGRGYMGGNMESPVQRISRNFRMYFRPRIEMALTTEETRLPIYIFALAADPREVLFRNGCLELQRSWLLTLKPGNTPDFDVVHAVALIASHQAAERSVANCWFMPPSFAEDILNEYE